MEHRLHLTPLLAYLAALASAATLFFFLPVQAQTPSDLIFELPLIQLHSSAASGVGGYNIVPLTVDVNADGLADLVMSWQNPQNSGWTQFVYLNNGNGWDIVYNCSRADAMSPWVGDCDYRN